MRKTYTLAQVQKIGSEALRCAQDIILDQECSYELKVRAIQAVSNMQSSYAKLIESTSLEDRLKKLERAINETGS